MLRSWRLQQHDVLGDAQNLSKSVIIEHTLPKTNSSPLTNAGWKMSFLLGPGLFSGAMFVSFGEGT